MNTVFFTVSSGSSGNCAFAGYGKQGILIDAGAPMKTVAAALDFAGYSLKQLIAIFITHEHTDHIKNLKTIACRLNIPIFCNTATANAIIDKQPQIDPSLFCAMKTGGSAKGGEFKVTSFAVSHDAAEPVGYTVETKNAAISLLTDSGHVTDDMFKNIKNSDIVLLESNYDHDMLIKGSYPYFLKERIMSKQGHLSNDDCAKTVLKLVDSGVKHIIMGHLSQHNNNPKRAYDTTKQHLGEKGVSNGDFTLVTAPRLCPCEIHSL